MKKYNILISAFVAVLLFSGCSLHSIVDQFNSQNAGMLKSNIEINEYFMSLNKQPNADNEMTDKYKDYNLISILAESMEFRFTNKYITPNLYRIIDNSYYFENFFVDEVQAGATCNSEYVSLVGLLPTSASSFRHTLCTKFYDNIFPYAIPGQLRDFDYDTYFFHNGYASFYYRNVYTNNWGFETSKFGDDLYNDTAYGQAHKNEMGSVAEFSDNYLIGFFEEYLNPDHKFYANVMTYTMHGGYGVIPTTSEEKKYIDEKMGLYAAELGHNIVIPAEIYSYYNKMVQFDNFIGKLFNYLENHNILDKTLISISRDHHPYMINSKDYIKFLNDQIDKPLEESSIERFRSPFMIYDFAFEQTKAGSKKITYPGTLIDVPPTILNMLIGKDGEYNYYFGNDMFNGDALIYITAQGYMGNNILVTDGLKDENGNIKNSYELLLEYIGDKEFEDKFKKYLDTKIFEYKLQSSIFDNDFFRYI